MTTSDDSAPFDYSATPHVDEDEAGPTDQGLAVGVRPPQPLRELAAAAPPRTKGRKLPGNTVRVTLLDPGTDELLEPVEVRVDNRDYLAFDMSARALKLPAGNAAPFVFASFTAWSAGHRTGAWSMPWAQFQRLAVDVETLEETDEDSARPTQ